MCKSNIYYLSHVFKQFTYVYCKINQFEVEERYLQETNKKLLQLNQKNMETNAERGRLNEAFNELNLTASSYFKTRRSN